MLFFTFGELDLQCYYRPIAILPVVSKTLKLHQQQFEFRAKHLIKTANWYLLGKK